MPKILLALLLVFLSGCATGPIYMPLSPERLEIFDSFDNNHVYERNVGERLYHFEIIQRVWPGFVALRNFETPAPMGWKYPPIEAGSEWRAIGRSGGQYLCKNEKKRMLALINQLTHYGEAPGTNVCLVISLEGVPQGTALCEGGYGPHDHEWKEKPAEVFKPINIFEEKARIGVSIVYAGRVQNTVRILYREFLFSDKDMELTYDFSESNVINIGGISFEILDATNSSIKYKIRTTPTEMKEIIEKQKKKFEAT